MSKIKKESNLDLIKNRWNRIFKSRESIIWPFQSRIKSYLILFPTNGYWLQKNQYNALLQTLDAIEDGGFIFSTVEAENFLESDEHWWCEKLPYGEYLNIPAWPLECALYSANYDWGILISQEYFALVGGSEEFISEFKKNYPEWEDDFAKFKKELMNDSSVTWLGEFLESLPNKL